MKHLLVFAAVVISAYGFKIPQVCRLNDPNFNKCLESEITETLHALVNGSTSLGIGTLEPFFIPKLEIESGKSGSVSLNQLYENVNLHGLTSFKIYDLESSVQDKGCFLRFKSNNPMVRMMGDYKLKGRVLLFNIDGKGKCDNVLYEVEGIHDAKCEKFEKKNKIYYRITDYSMKINPKRVVFDFESVLGEQNAKLSKEILKTINESALEVFADVKPAFEKTFSIVFKKVGNSILSKVPREDIIAEA